MLMASQHGGQGVGSNADGVAGRVLAVMLMVSQQGVGHNADGRGLAEIAAAGG